MQLFICEQLIEILHADENSSYFEKNKIYYVLKI